MQMPNT